VEIVDTVNKAVDKFEHADPNHPPRQGFGTPLVVGLVAYSVILTVAVVVYVALTAF